MKIRNLSTLILALALSAGFCQSARRFLDRYSGVCGTAMGLEPKNMPPAPGLADNTLRQIVQVSIGGSQLRVKFSNAFGTNAITLTSAHIALSAGGSAIQTNTDTALAFNGRPSISIPAGESVWSDNFNFTLPPLADVAVTTRFGEMSEALTGHPGSRTTSYLQSGDAVTAANLSGVASTAHWYVLKHHRCGGGHSRRRRCHFSAIPSPTGGFGHGQKRPVARRFGRAIIGRQRHLA